jgi:hypothetical protein
VKRTLELKRITAALGVLALVAAASCSQVADDCQLNVTCPGDGVTATGGGGMSSTSSSGGGSSSSTGGSTSCTPSTIEPCAYSGPAGTDGKGVCQAGQHTCQADGMSFGACMGEVLPTAEDCVDAVDEDCSGDPACTGAIEGGAGFGESVTDEAILAVATDPKGNIVLGGLSESTPNGPLDLDISTGTGVVTKLGPTGQKLWSKAVTTGGGGHSVVRGVATDAAGGVLIVGSYAGAIVGGDFTLPTADGIDIFLIKLDALTGTTVWQKRFTGPSAQYPSAVSLDSSGNILLTGTTYGPVDFGGGSKVAGSSADLFVAKLDKEGNHVWSGAFGDGSTQIGYGVAATPEGDVVVAGLLNGAMNLGVGKTITSAGGKDVFVAKLKGDTGVALSAYRYGDKLDQKAHGVAVGSDGSIVITGPMGGYCNFGGATLSAQGNADVFVAKLDASGTHVWSHNYGSGGEHQASLGVTIDPAQNIVVVGYFKGTLTFGATTLTDVSPASSASTDLFVAKLAADGSPVWARSFGDANDQAAWAVTTDASASVIVGGSFQGAMSLPPTLLSTGSYDSFWIKLAP